ncbi:response regulator transcription factor [Microbacterium sp. gxy059]|uniref:response regulator transcription factor n=1 Tax=Microbacterium sp. gxy059 TaxID=2957199 RepID=UPI003D96B518
MSGEIRVLVVDDDRTARALHGRFVAETPGFALTGAVGTGLGAVERSIHGDVDLILLDMRLPDISGVEVLHRLRTLGTTSPDVMVISSSRDQVTVRQALAAQIAGYLVKPLTQGALQQRLAAYRAERRERERERPQPLGQVEIDRLLSTGRIAIPGASARSGDPAPGLPKGLAAVTLERILGELDPVVPRSAGEVAQRSEVSRATARRYLDHLVAEGAITIAHRYGRRGRPEVLYRLSPRPGEGIG